MRVTFLGTGTSHGVPMIGCRCSTCRSNDRRDKRWRSSILIELADNTSVLVDTSPDLRSQVLAFKVSRVDAILFTHSHADHVLGLNDMYRFNALQGQTIPCFADGSTLADIFQMFAYIFARTPVINGGVSQIKPYKLLGPFCLGRSTFVPIPIFHGDRLIFGYRVGNFAYLTDCSGIPDSSWELISGVEILVIDALRHRSHSSHFTVDEAIAFAERIRPRLTYLTHMCHDILHADTSAMLPEAIELAYDGLVIDVE